MRLLLVMCAALSACKSGSGGTPAVPYGIVRLQFAVDASITPFDDLKKSFPKGAQSFGDHEFVTVLMPEKGSHYPADPALHALLVDIAMRPGASGGSLHLFDDGDGRTLHIAAVAGRDAAEIAMALVDAWAPELELDLEMGRVMKIERLRAAGNDIPGRMRRLPGATLARSGEAMVLRLPFPGDGAVTRGFAAGLVEDFFPAPPRDPVTTGTNGP